MSQVWIQRACPCLAQGCTGEGHFCNSPCLWQRLETEAVVCLLKQPAACMGCFLLLLLVSLEDGEEGCIVGL